LQRPPLVDAVDRDTFQRTGRAQPAAPDAASPLRFASCGLPLPGHEIRIVDTAGREVGDRQEGRLEFQGPSASAGYFRNPEATARFVRGAWRDSGDRAYIAGGEVYLTGRIKDVIIRAGRNLYPHELEEAVGSLPGVRKGCVAVFGTSDQASGTERLVILAETREQDESGLETLRASIQDVAIDLLGTPADEVVLAPPHAVPKTSSGKIRRSAARELYESGAIGRRGASLVWQLVRLALSAVKTRLGRWGKLAADLLYAGWFWVAVGLAVVFLLPPILLAPTLPLRRRVARRMARWTGALLGIRLRVEGLEHLAGPGARVVVANHQSYLDGIAFTAGLPADLAYVAKKELAQGFFTRTVLSRLGALFVERFDVKESVEGADQAVAAVRGGVSLLVFPEGTFRRYPGLLPFRLGAFVVAAEAGVPVVPVAVRGTRSILRGDDMFPRHGSVTIAVAPPIQAQGTGWPAAVALRDAARAEILARSGEPEL
jgi:1-acyl-sn-glycerol-3-phosphate acyltransferase